MSYLIEFGADPAESFYAEIVFININSGSIIKGDDIDHQLVMSERGFCDYGRRTSHRTVIASNSNGFITVPAPGVISINVPPSNLTRFGRSGQSLRGKLIAIPNWDKNFTKVIADVVISIGEWPMPSPRISLRAYPLYPNSATAVPDAVSQDELDAAISQVSDTTAANLTAAIATRLAKSSNLSDLTDINIALTNLTALLPTTATGLGIGDWWMNDGQPTQIKTL